MKHIRILPYLVSATFLMAGCLPSGEDVDEKTGALSYKAGESQFAANTLMNGSLAITSRIVSGDAWQTGSVTEGPIGSAVINAAVASTAANALGSAVCVINSDTYLVSWLKADKADSAAIRASNSTAVIANLSMQMPKSGFGHAEKSAITLADGRVQELAGGCKTLSIPNGTPVILSRLGGGEQGAIKNLEVSRIETRQLPCGDGKAGVVLQKRVTTFGGKAGAASASSAWETELDQCVEKTEVPETKIARGNLDITTNFATYEDTAQSVPADGTQERQKTTMEGALREQLSAMDCTTTTVGVNNTRTSSYNRNHSDREHHQTSIAGGTSGYTGTISNCASTATLTPSAPVVSLKEVDKVEQTREIPCTGQSGTGNATLGLFSGTVNTSAWSGIAKFVRYAPVYSDGKNNTNVKNVAWKPYSLSCERNDTMVLTCGTLTPALTGTLTPFVDNKDMTYVRTLKIDGFKDPAALTPADPTISWAHKDGLCRWSLKKTYTPTCNEDQEAIDGEEDQVIIADALAPAGYKTGDTAITVAGRCEAMKPVVCNGPFEPTSIDVKVTDLGAESWRVGTIGDNYWRGSCATYDRKVEFTVADLADVSDFRLHRAEYDDYVWVTINGETAFSGPDGLGKLWVQGGAVQYENGARRGCERGTSWKWRSPAGRDLKSLLKKGTNTIFIRTVVSGGGEMALDFRLTVNSCTAPEFHSKFSVPNGHAARIGYDLTQGTAWVISSDGVTNRELEYYVPKLDYDKVCRDMGIRFKPGSNDYWRSKKGTDETLSVTSPQTPNCSNRLVGVVDIVDKDVTIRHENDPMDWTDDTYSTVRDSTSEKLTADVMVKTFEYKWPAGESPIALGQQPGAITFQILKRLDF